MIYFPKRTKMPVSQQLI